VNRDDVIKKIKSKGYWEINIHPVTYQDVRVSATKLRELIKSCVVELRGWDYPHIHQDEGGPNAIPQGIEKYFDSGDYLIEFWRLTTSFNFYHLIALIEDWMPHMQFNTSFTRKGKC